MGDIVDRVTRKNKLLETNRPLTISAQYGLIDQTDFFKKTVASQDLSNYYLILNGEFAYNKSYSSEYPWGAIKRLDLYDKGALSSLYICFKPKDIIESDYLVHYFESTKWHQGVADVAGEGARNHGLLNIAIPDYFNTIHYLPEIAEQRKIADFLNLIEERIVIQNKVIEKYESLIKALYEQLIPGDRDDHAALGTLVRICKGKQLNGEFLSEDGKYYVMNGGITPSGYYDDYNTPAGTISISEGGNSCGFVQYNEKPFWSGGHCYTLLQTTDERVQYKFLYHLLKSKQDDIMALRIGSGLPNIQKKDIGRFPIPMLPLEHQKAITRLLDSVYKHIEYEQALLAELVHLKSFFLGALFI